jgi:ABC-type dipeptide/oligopeptide/nickel transport system permease subunit
MTALSAPVLAASRKRRDWAFYPCLAILAVAVGAAVLSPWVTPYDPAATSFDAIWVPPSPAHWLGTDQLGRDLLSRVVDGARPTLLGSMALLALATALGVLIGLTAAWHRGWVDTLLARITDVMFAFPGLLFVVMIIAVFDSGTVTAVVGMGLAYAPVIAKFTRAIALEELARPYVDSYRLQGAGAFELCLRYVLPNMLPTLLGYLVVLFGDGLMSLATLNFLGFGSQPPSSDWGLMVEESRTGVIQGVLGPALVPGLTIAIVVVATNVVGVRLSDKLAVRR